MTDLKPNAELAYKVLDHIDAHPEQHYQQWWLRQSECGTQACFAGWACILSGDKPLMPSNPELGDQFDDVELPDGSRDFVSDRARRLLGIEEYDADSLFFSMNTRENLTELVADIFGPRPGGAS